MGFGVVRMLVLMFALILTGCASLPAPSPNATAAPVDRELTGRLSVHYRDTATDHEETTFANFDWAERGKNVQLSLFDPLGQTVARIDSDPANSVLILRDGRRFSGATPEALTREALGWTLPVRGLVAWLEGRPAQASSAISASATGTGRQIAEDGWTIVYPEAGDPINAPRRINLSYPGPPVAIDLRIVVDHRSGT